MVEPTEQDRAFAREIVGDDPDEDDVRESAAGVIASARESGYRQAVADVVAWLRDEQEAGEIVASVWREIAQGDGERAAWRLGNDIEQRFGGKVGG